MRIDGFADLHLHTTHSDGQHAPKAVIDKCASTGLRAVSIVDHDDVSAISEATRCGENVGIEVIPGVELSVTWEGYDLHVLGYCIDHENADLINYLNIFKKARIERARQIVEKLGALGVTIPFEAVQHLAGPGTIGRPHIAQVLVENGLVKSFQDAFDRFIGDGKPANVLKYKIDLENALKLIRSAGGVSVVAHPGLQLDIREIEKLTQAGIDGIEVIHPAHDDDRVQLYRKLAYDHNLVETGGSDFHGGKKGDSVLGKHRIPYDWVTRVKALADEIKTGSESLYDH
ncbi:PHP domain-containing protein [bacterium]|nr:PHP domain-containing protein [bacterium]